MIRKRVFWLFIGALCFSPISAQARVFNINKEKFSAYIRGTWGPSFESTLNSESSGSGVTLNSSHSNALSGEFGFAYVARSANLRFGLEVLRPKEISDSPGTDSAGTEMYQMTSEISILVPKVMLEISLKKWAVSRLFIAGGAGYASLAARNSYTFTPSSTFGLQDFYEDLRGGALMSEGLLGFESLLTDTTTYVIEGGYRSVNFAEIKHNRDTTTFQGPVFKGDPATNMDGSKRALNFSNYYVGVSLRFWL